MTTKKIVMIVVGIVLVLGLIVAIFVGGIVGITLYTIGHSDAAETAKTYLRENARLKQDIGDVQDFGSFVTGNIDIKNADGNATIHIKVIGQQKTVNASVDLAYRNGQRWRVVGASYVNDAGQTVELMNPYQTQKQLLRLAA
jgi:Cytochrome oxidase complex assembly protein 1